MQGFPDRAQNRDCAAEPGRAQDSARDRSELTPQLYNQKSWVTLDKLLNLLDTPFPGLSNKGIC